MTDEDRLNGPGCTQARILRRSWIECNKTIEGDQNKLPEIRLALQDSDGEIRNLSGELIARVDQSNL